MTTNYYLFPANYLTYDFQKLFKEEAKSGEGKILWSHNKNDPKNMKVGDICYLYYSNLPDNTSRIILRGIISGINIKDPDDQTKNCVEIQHLQTVNWKNKGRYLFTCDILKNKYNITITRNKRQLKKNRDEKNGKDYQLKDALEKCYENDSDRRTLSELRTDIEKRLRCEFDSTGETYKHSTFQLQNGFNYYETHHFIQQSVKNRFKNDPDLEDLIYNEKNMIYLCPVCHRKIHYGKKTDIKAMVNSIYKRQADFYNVNFLKYAQAEGAPTVIDWLYKMYKC